MELEEEEGREGHESGRPGKTLEAHASAAGWVPRTS